MKKNLLFIPVYNSEKEISKLINKIKNINFSEIDTLLIIDNCSFDKTYLTVKNLLRNFKIKTKIIRNKKNLGLGGSFKKAFEFAINNNFNYIIHYHGNNMNEIRDLKKILNNKRFYRFDFYLGSRFMKKSKIKNYSFIRQITNHLFNFIFSFISKMKILDLGSSLNVFKTKNFKDGVFKNFSNDLTFQYYLILYIGHYNKSFNYFPISVNIKHKSNVVPFKHVIKMISIIFTYACFKSSFFKK